MRKEMEEELARSMEQNRQEMMNMETSWQQRLQESEQKIVIVRAHPWGVTLFVILVLQVFGIEGTRGEEEGRSS